MIKKRTRNEMRIIRHKRIRKKVYGTKDKPRMAVFKSLRYIYVQIIDDEAGHTMVSASTLEKGIREKLSSTSNIEAAKYIGKVVAERALSKGIKEVVFDRGGHKYHGAVKALADAAREAGLKF